MSQEGTGLRQLLVDHHVLVASDNQWQQRARLMQGLWRERQRPPLDPGIRGPADASPLGSRLTLADGEPPALRNYLTEAARVEVMKAVAESGASGALLSRPRLWVDLLSSQPLCFNLFASLAADLDLASKVFSALMPDRILTVTSIEFEHSPGRGNADYTGNRSAFDVFIGFEGPRGPGFFGIEVKYHENLAVKEASDPDGRYPRLAEQTGGFKAECIAQLQRTPLQQLWLDHLLVLRMRQAHPDQWADAAFVLVYPEGNERCADVARQYSACLSDTSTFEVVTMESIVEAGRAVSEASWIEDVFDRYLNEQHIGDALTPSGASR